MVCGSLVCEPLATSAGIDEGTPTVTRALTGLLRALLAVAVALAMAAIVTGLVQAMGAQIVEGLTGQ